MKQLNWIVCAVLLATLVMLGYASDAVSPGFKLDAGDAGGSSVDWGELGGRGVAGASGASDVDSAGSGAAAGSFAAAAGSNSSAGAAVGGAGGTGAAMSAGADAGIVTAGTGGSGGPAAGSGGAGAGGQAGSGGAAAAEGALPFNACKCRLSTNGPFITSRDWCDPPPAGTRTVNELDASDIEKCASRQAVNRATCCNAPRKIVVPATCKIPSGRVYTCEDFSSGADAATDTPAPGNIVITWMKTTATGSTAYADCLQPQGSVCAKGASCDVHLMTASSHVTGVCL